jgi:hypothetical protein
VLDHEEDEGEAPVGNGASPRRILKVRLRQDQVIRLHELRILQGKSIAALLEGILEDYFQKLETGNGSSARAELRREGGPPA